MTRTPRLALFTFLCCTAAVAPAPAAEPRAGELDELRRRQTQLRAALDEVEARIAEFEGQRESTGPREVVELKGFLNGKEVWNCDGLTRYTPQKATYEKKGKTRILRLYYAEKPGLRPYGGPSLDQIVGLAAYLRLVDAYNTPLVRVRIESRDADADGVRVFEVNLDAVLGELDAAQQREQERSGRAPASVALVRLTETY